MATIPLRVLHLVSEARTNFYQQPIRMLAASLLAVGVSSLHLGVGAEAKDASAMSRCLATWDRTSGMSKRTWKQTCKRVVKRHPGLYSKPF
jgi:hypothetical protein